MSTQAKASFAIKSWDEHTWDGKPAQEVSGAKFTRAQVTYAYQGDIEGEGVVQYLMMYGADGTGTYIGLEQITGSIAGRPGSFVLQHNGTFDQNGVKGTVSTVPGSGTGDLHNFHSQGSLDIAGHQEHYPIILNDTFE